MGWYPINIKLDGRNCIVIGGGKVAERKICLLLVANAKVTVVSPVLSPQLAAMAQAGEICHVARVYCPGDMRSEQYLLAFCATDNPAVNHAAAAEAVAAGVLVNAIDDSSRSDFSIPAQMTRGDLLFTVSTGGKSPVLARRLLEEVADNYGMEYSGFLDWLAIERENLRRRLGEAGEREVFWRKAVDGDVVKLLRQGKINEAQERVKHVLEQTGADD